jgi:hypothetical protein
VGRLRQALAAVHDTTPARIFSLTRLMAAAVATTLPAMFVAGSVRGRDMK